ncbi:hypothetical protein EYB26_002937 [Talaromyces marneffei]|uniref:uncharacterized protein n=1 Tax=Talaromyces marneffei TaxID=37727 RepID=UPI0012A809B3|nr:uncharacterized protein EYB26_002937 [Talaromyces marneffei]QGA15280.1 hypothetical protein EYB26_002937 [Talaromyces marneffei]
MRLRQTIRAPSRYEDECELSTGVSPRRLPRRRKAAAAVAEERAIAYVDYNPNQPPAAFPTLDHPLPAGQTYHSPTTTASTSAAAAAAASANRATGDADHEADGHHLDAFDSLYRGIPPAELDNFIASNGPQNPQYKRNMALPAREDDNFDFEISDDDDEQQPPGNDAAGEQWIHREEPIPTNPQWSDISSSLQIEIAENMLETHRLSTIQLLLGLNQCDTDQLTLNLNMKKEDLEYENRILEEMRNKQLQALMCLDNSDLKQHSVPARLVMSRKVWNQCHHMIQKQSKMRYLFCQARDLLLAQKFLSKRGLPMIYAGDWDNQFVATPSISNTAGVPETLQWKSTAESQSNSSAAAGSTELLPGNPLHSATGTQTGVQGASPATVNGLPIVRLASTQLSNPMPRASTQQTSNEQQLVLPNQALVHLKIGPRNAARIHIDQPAMRSRRHMDMLLATPRPQVREPNSDDTIEESPSGSTGLDGMHHQYSMPVRRMFGSWSTGLSQLQPPKPSLPTRPLTGSFNSIIHPEDNHIRLPKLDVEMCLATPKSYRTAVSERQLQSSISAYQQSPMPPSDDAEFEDSGSASASYSSSDATVMEPKKEQRTIQAETDVFSPSKAMKGLNLLPSVSLNPIETAKRQPAEVSSFVAQPETNTNRLPDEALQGTINSFKMLQPSKPTKHTKPLFGFDRFEIHTDNQKATQNANISQQNQPYPSTGQGQISVDTIDTSRDESSVMTDKSAVEVSEPPSTNAETANAAKPETKDLPSDHLSPISANVAADGTPSTRKTRQSTRKQTTGTKRDASTEIKTTRPKRGKNLVTSPNLITNQAATPTSNPPVTRGRGRPRKHPVQ